MSGLALGWAEARLGDVATTQLGRMLAAHRETGTYARPYLRNRDVQWGTINTSALPVMDFDPTDAHRFRLEPGDVLICEGGEVGRTAVWQGHIEECYYQKALHRVRTSPALAPLFLRYLMEHYASQRRFDPYTSGSTIAHLPQEDLRNLPLKLPPRMEQERIVAVIEEQFSRLDAGVAAVDSARQKLKRMRAAILRDTFSGQCEEIGGQARTVPLATVVTSCIGGLWGQPSPGDASWVEVAVIRGAEFRTWATRRAETAPRRWVPIRQLGARRLQDGDLVLEVSGGGPDQPVGRVVLIDQRTLEAVELPLVTSNFCRRLTLNERVMPRYLFYHLTWLYERGATVPFQKATTNIRNLTVSDYLAGTGIVVPDVVAQHAVVERLDALLDAAGRLDQECVRQISRATSLRSSILAIAFSGNLVAQDPRAEPASILLNRIAAERAALNGRARTGARKRRTPRKKVTA